MICHSPFWHASCPVNVTTRLGFGTLEVLCKKGVAYEPVCNFGQVRRLRLVPAPESAKNIYRRDVFRSAELEYVSSLFPQRARPATGQDRGPQGFGHWKSNQEKDQNADENTPFSPARVGLLVKRKKANHGAT